MEYVRTIDQAIHKTIEKFKIKNANSRELFKLKPDELASLIELFKLKPDELASLIEVFKKIID